MVLQQSASSMELNKIKRIPPPGPPGLPFVGMLPFLGKHLHLELDQLTEQYGNIFQLHVGGRKLVVLSGLETIKEALVKQQDKFNARADFGVYKLPPQCTMLELKSGAAWKKHHEIVTQVMHTFFSGKSDKLESWLLEESEDLANLFLKFDSKAFDPNLYLPLATLSFMQRLMFDEKGSLEDSPENADFVSTARILTAIPPGTLDVTKIEILPAIWRPLFILFRWKSLQNFRKAVDAMGGYVEKNVVQHQASFDPENLRDMADGLLQACNEQTDSDRQNFQLDLPNIAIGTLAQFTGAGTEFPRLLIHWSLLYMITYPEVQARIQAELDRVVGRDQKPNLSHRGKLPFTEACLNEIFRHASPTNLPAVTYGTTDDTTLGGYFIPKNTPVLINYYGLTRDRRYWPEPEQFNPDRFLDENGKLKNSLLDKFYPFGVGSRRCLGEHLGRIQIFLLFTNLLHKCKFEQVPTAQLSLEPQPGFFMGPQDYQVLATPRY